MTEADVLTSTKGQRNLPRLFAQAFATAQRLRRGRIDVVLPDGRRFAAIGAEDGAHGVILVRNEGLFGRLLRDGDIGLAESYMDGWWDTPDLQSVMDVILDNNKEVARAMPGIALVRAFERVRHRLRDNSVSQAAKNISHHYDLGNAFYDKWLDRTMTYSSALFDGAEDRLAAAQTRKYAALCDKIGTAPDQHVLEIGCGWGGFAEYAAAERGVKVTGLTISREQHDFAKQRMFEAGLAERVEIVMRDYREERGSYDGVASIEMFEAVGERYWPTYFDTVHQRLRPGARGALQIITIENSLFAQYRKSVDFIQKYIFPGGMLPSPDVLRQQIERAGLVYVDSHEFGQSYSDTLRRWYDGFNAAWDEIATLGFDARFQRMWNFYLTSCAASFKSGTTDVTQVTLARPS
ncbi:MAG: cyclopropane-fatty-acyl-phospholipid synthase family protein [Pseudomonadota bacterium]